MSEVKHTIELHTYEDGPWFLDSDALESLDEIFKSNKQRINTDSERKLTALQADRIKEIESDPNLAVLPEQIRESRKQREIDFIRDSFGSIDLRPCDYKVSVNLGGNKSLHASSFKEIVADPVFSQEQPGGFTAELRGHGWSCSVSVDEHQSYRSRTLRLSAHPDENVNAKVVYGEVNRWVKSVESPKWQKYWLSKPASFLLILWPLFTFSILFTFLSAPSESIRQSLLSEAKKLLEKGVSLYVE